MSVVKFPNFIADESQTIKSMAAMADQDHAARLLSVCRQFVQLWPVARAVDRPQEYIPSPAGQAYGSLP